MRLSSKTDYGLRALIDLALHESGLPVQSHDIAARQGIPESYLNPLLILLRSASGTTARRCSRYRASILTPRPPLHRPKVAKDVSLVWRWRGGEQDTDLLFRAGDEVGEVLRVHAVPADGEAVAVEEPADVAQ